MAEADRATPWSCMHRAEPHDSLPDSFKGTYTAAEVAAHIASGIRSIGGTAQEMPVADGGEGTFDVIFRLQAQPLAVKTLGPWGDEAEAVIGLSQDGTAIVELASASGLNMPTRQTRDPIAASTYAATGQRWPPQEAKSRPSAVTTRSFVVSNHRCRHGNLLRRSHTGRYGGHHHW